MDRIVQSRQDRHVIFELPKIETPADAVKALLGGKGGIRCSVLRKFAVQTVPGLYRTARSPRSSVLTNAPTISDMRARFNMSGTHF